MARMTGAMTDDTMTDAGGSAFFLVASAEEEGGGNPVQALRRGEDLRVPDRPLVGVEAAKMNAVVL